MPEGVTCIIPAAGSSLRFGEDKIFKPLLGKPLLEWTLLPFLKVEEVEEIILVLRSESLEEGKNRFLGGKVKKVVPGGETRELSVFCGFKESRKAPLVLVHDGDRPCTSPSLIKRVIKELEIFEAVVPALKVKETLKAASNEMVVRETLGKDYFLAQTPQGFRREVLERAFREIGDFGKYSDDSGLVEKLGVPVRIVPGEETNVKVTTPLDFKIAELFLKEGKVV
ncbi:MAG: 2-C-methyl-D-erythritol 4-phosphate cytidylyltransferase [Caldiserica bacterium]|jgi:2-C-methyl-D-erythritol 4-phosphate cytidylyltransferase|nr:2-C-methyl-D-erythritol 4-phosphate cytidylyltransferase [Caldisericota bacterium]MDH7563013.1 IspD/TarI family cytidylyltransferase [Caldisericota bacterium]